MDWTKKRKADLERQLKAAYSTLIESRRLHRRIRELLNFHPGEPYIAGDSGSISSFLKWFSEIGALNIAEIKRKAEEGRWVRRFTQPNTKEIGNSNLQDPATIMQYVKKELQNYLELRSREVKELEKRIQGVRQQIHSFDVEEENRFYGRESVRLTKVNIIMSIFIPLTTFLVGLLLSLLMESAKPEIVQWIRELLGLKGNP